MDERAFWCLETKEVPPRRTRLLFLSRDGRPFKVAQQQGANASMRNRYYRARARGGARETSECPHDTGLGGDSRLPPADAFVRSGKESIDGHFKLRLREVTGC
jgi:hypothetical protein